MTVRKGDNQEGREGGRERVSEREREGGGGGALVERGERVREELFGPLAPRGAVTAERE